MKIEIGAVKLKIACGTAHHKNDGSCVVELVAKDGDGRGKMYLSGEEVANLRRRARQIE